MRYLVHAFRGCLLAALFSGAALAQSFDHSYAKFDVLLGKYVAWNAAGVTTAVDYAGFSADRTQLKGVLDSLSLVTPAQYDTFSRDQKLAFLINAYNAYTIELILTKYPDLKSIRDLGGLFSGSPWKKEFFQLLGEERHLDWVEHETIRAKGVFDEPRIHFVVNCASIGCPALRPDAMTALKLESQLADSTRRFFSDRSRNRYDAASDELQVTKLLDWYDEDFEQGYQGVTSVAQFLGRYAEVLADDPAIQERIRKGVVDIDFLDYDWALNTKP